MGVPSGQGRSGLGSDVGGGAARPADEIDAVWFKARELGQTLGDEQLADQTTVDYIRRRVEDPKTFREMFDKARKAEAGRFSDVVTGVGKSLDAMLQETLSAKKLHSEGREECPAKFRSFVDAYFEALSKTTARKAAD